MIRYLLNKLVAVDVSPRLAKQPHSHEVRPRARIKRPACVPAWLCGLCILCGLMPARAVLQSFQFTNIVPAGLAVTSWPTNSPTTTYWSSGVLPGQTNQYLLGYQTGNAIEVKNYQAADFEFECNYTSSNAATVDFDLVRGSSPFGAGKPQVLINTNTGAILENDFESQVWLPDRLLVNLPPGTNVAFNWRTNLYVGSADYIGIYQETNSVSVSPNYGGIGWMSNIVVGIDKKIVPLRYP